MGGAGDEGARRGTREAESEAGEYVEVAEEVVSRPRRQLRVRIMSPQPFSLIPNADRCNDFWRGQGAMDIIWSTRSRY